ncbi:MAG: Rrf2 family transcriptional regulator, partial [Elusimicrobiota bacterium]|nr:Rrf2 family transcriptional regulator [Elusimicrobiota bacterium]
MRISAKARYGLASMIYLAQNYDSQDYITLITLSEKLKISKIYLEQVFSMLKHAGIVISIKGSQGGYKLINRPQKINIFDILSSIEISLFEKTRISVLEGDQFIEKAMHNIIFDKLDDSI